MMKQNRQAYTRGGMSSKNFLIFVALMIVCHLLTLRATSVSDVTKKSLVGQKTDAPVDTKVSATTTTSKQQSTTSKSIVTPTPASSSPALTTISPAKSESKSKQITSVAKQDSKKDFKLSTDTPAKLKDVKATKDQSSVLSANTKSLGDKGASSAAGPKDLSAAEGHHGKKKYIMVKKKPKMKKIKMEVYKPKMKYKKIKMKVPVKKMKKKKVKGYIVKKKKHY